MSSPGTPRRRRGLPPPPGSDTSEEPPPPVPRSPTSLRMGRGMTLGGGRSRIRGRGSAAQMRGRVGARRFPRGMRNRGISRGREMPSVPLGRARGPRRVSGSGPIRGRIGRFGPRRGTRRLPAPRDLSSTSVPPPVVPRPMLNRSASLGRILPNPSSGLASPGPAPVPKRSRNRTQRLGLRASIDHMRGLTLKVGSRVSLPVDGLSPLDIGDSNSPPPPVTRTRTRGSGTPSGLSRSVRRIGLPPRPPKAQSRGGGRGSVPVPTTPTGTRTRTRTRTSLPKQPELQPQQPLPPAVPRKQIRKRYSLSIRSRTPTPGDRSTAAVDPEEIKQWLESVRTLSSSAFSGGGGGPTQTIRKKIRISTPTATGGSISSGSGDSSSSSSATRSFRLATATARARARSGSGAGSGVSSASALVRSLRETQRANEAKLERIKQFEDLRQGILPGLAHLVVSGRDISRVLEIFRLTRCQESIVSCFKIAEGHSICRMGEEFGMLSNVAFQSEEANPKMKKAVTQAQAQAQEEEGEVETEREKTEESSDSIPAVASPVVPVAVPSKRRGGGKSQQFRGSFLYTFRSEKVNVGGICTYASRRIKITPYIVHSFDCNLFDISCLLEVFSKPLEVRDPDEDLEEDQVRVVTFRVRQKKKKRWRAFANVWARYDLTGKRLDLFGPVGDPVRRDTLQRIVTRIQSLDILDYYGPQWGVPFRVLVFVGVSQWFNKVFKWKSEYFFCLFLKDTSYDSLEYLFRVLKKFGKINCCVIGEENFAENYAVLGRLFSPKLVTGYVLMPAVRARQRGRGLGVEEFTQRLADERSAREKQFREEEEQEGEGQQPEEEGEDEGDEGDEGEDEAEAETETEADSEQKSPSKKYKRLTFDIEPFSLQSAPCFVYTIPEEGGKDLDPQVTNIDERERLLRYALNSDDFPVHGSLFAMPKLPETIERDKDELTLLTLQLTSARADWDRQADIDRSSTDRLRSISKRLNEYQREVQEHDDYLRLYDIDGAVPAGRHYQSVQIDTDVTHEDEDAHEITVRCMAPLPIVRMNIEMSEGAQILRQSGGESEDYAEIVICSGRQSRHLLWGELTVFCSRRGMNQVIIEHRKSQREETLRNIAEIKEELDSLKEDIKEGVLHPLESRCLDALKTLLKLETKEVDLLSPTCSIKYFLEDARKRRRQ